MQKGEPRNTWQPCQPVSATPQGRPCGGTTHMQPQRRKNSQCNITSEALWSVEPACPMHVVANLKLWALNTPIESCSFGTDEWWVRGVERCQVGWSCHSSVLGLIKIDNVSFSCSHQSLRQCVLLVLCTPGIHQLNKRVRCGGSRTYASQEVQHSLIWMKQHSHYILSETS
jgi:hypothetical protein